MDSSPDPRPSSSSGPGPGPQPEPELSSVSRPEPSSAASGSTNRSSGGEWTSFCICTTVSSVGFCAAASWNCRKCFVLEYILRIIIYEHTIKKIHKHKTT